MNHGTVQTLKSRQAEWSEDDDVFTMPVHIRQRGSSYPPSSGIIWSRVSKTMSLEKMNAIRNAKSCAQNFLMLEATAFISLAQRLPE